MNLKLASLYAGGACCVLLLGWVMFFDGNDEFTQSREIVNDQKSSVRESLSHKPREKRINVKARLAVLYEKYPDLKPDYPESDKDFTELFLRLFPKDEKLVVGRLFRGEFEGVLTENAPWDEAKARKFLAEEEWRLKALIESADSKHPYKEVRVMGWNDALRLMSTSYGLNLKLGNVDQAIAVRGAMEAMTATSSKADMNGMALAVAFERRLDEYAFAQSTEYPEEVENALAAQVEKSYVSALQGEFSSTMELIYRRVQVDESGTFSLENEGGEGAVPIELIEEVVADLTLLKMEFFQELEGSEIYMSGQDIDAELERYIKESNFTEQELSIAEVYSRGSADYYEGFKRHQFLREAKQAAFDLAKHVRNSPREVYFLALPRNHKTGESVVWDKERGVLKTHLEGQEAEIKIPVLNSQ